MKNLKNTKGFTLVEVVVVLLMSSIVLGIIGGLITGSLGNFEKTANQDLSKRAVDSTSDFINDEIIFASDVRVYSEGEAVAYGIIEADGTLKEGWSSFGIKNGRLYKDGVEAFGEAFYKNRDLKMKVVGYDSSRLDLYYTFEDDGKEVYTTYDTLEFMNIKVKVERDETFRPFSNLSDEVEIKDDMKIYYRKDFEELPPDEVDEVEELKCIDDYNNRGTFLGGRYYRKGDYVRYDGAWWVNVNLSRNFDDSESPGSNFHWKKLDRKYAEYSGYIQGDIVKYEGEYYRVKVQHIEENRPPNEMTYAWEKISEIPDVDYICPNEVKDTTSTVIEKLKDIDLNTIEVYDDTKFYEYQKDDIVKAYDKEHDIWYYYIMVVDSNSFDEVVDPKELSRDGRTPWQIMQRDYDDTSAYVKGDVVMLYVGSEIYYLECIQDIDVAHTAEFMHQNLYSSNEVWKYWKKFKPSNY